MSGLYFDPPVDLFLKIMRHVTIWYLYLIRISSIYTCCRFPRMWPEYALFNTSNKSLLDSQPPCKRLDKNSPSSRHHNWKDQLFSLLVCVALCKVFRMPGSEKISSCEIGIPGFWIWNSSRGIRNPLSDWNPESKFPGIRIPRTVWNLVHLN